MDPFKHIKTLNYKCFFFSAEEALEDEGPKGPGMSLTHCTGASINKDEEDPALKVIRTVMCTEVL